MTRVAGCRLSTVHAVAVAPLDAQARGRELLLGGMLLLQGGVKW